MKTILQKFLCIIALLIEIPLCALAFFLDAVIGGIVVLFRFVIRDKQGMIHSAKLMFEFAGFLIMRVVITFATLLGNNLNESC